MKKYCLIALFEIIELIASVWTAVIAVKTYSVKHQTVWLGVEWSNK